MTPIKIVFIGAGNVAWNLAPALDKLSGVDVVQVVARSRESALSVARLLSKSGVTTDSSDVYRSADLYIIAVNDGAVADVAQQYAGVNPSAIWAHTSGSVSIDTLRPLGPNVGVFYPMQTFSKGRDVSLYRVPFFIEGSTPLIENKLSTLASRLSTNVRVLSGDDRTLIHAAAVLSCNFTNHLWAIASELLARRDIPFDIMRQLVEETVEKAFTASPDLGQTGPAVRGDMSTIDAHARVIGEPYSQLYYILSASIIDRFKQE